MSAIRTKTGLLFTLCALAPTPVLAHVGTPPLVGIGAGLVHPFGGIDHLLVMMAVGLWAARESRPRQWVLPAVFLTAMVVGLQTPIGILAPIAEPAVVASLLILGGFLALTSTTRLSHATALAATAALMQGYIHGAEASPGIIGGTFTFGLLAGTAAVLIIGSGAGLMCQAQSRPWLTRVFGGLIASAGVASAFAL